MTKINVLGASVGAQFISGDPDRYDWRVSYQVEGRGMHFHTVSSTRAQSSQQAIEAAKRDLGLRD